jgi:hypothetical protein
VRPLDLVAGMVLEDGARWGEKATADQWDDMRSLLSMDGPRRHYWIRARGRSKTTDTGAATLATMLAGGIRAGDECYAAAAGREQAGLLARKVRGIAERTPELAGAAEVQQHRVITPRTGAILDVISSDLATSWGKTPRWLFIDEIANHPSGQMARDFTDALLTALIKRPDSQAVAATTPSDPGHWAKELWDTAVDSPLWRASIISGPAPWQDPAELEDERRRLPDFMWRRLFLCEWCSAGDALADDEALADCTRHDGPLPPLPGVPYVVAFDLSVSADHTAVAVAHLGERDGKREVILDRLEAWVPGQGRQVDLADVEAWIHQAAREYGGAMIVGDPYQAVSMIGRLREAGHVVKAVSFTAGTNSKRAQMLLRLVRDRQLDLPDEPLLRREFLSLRLAEGTTPGVLKLTSDGSSQGHFDRVTALMLAAEELLSRPTGSWRDYNGRLTDCAACNRGYLAAKDACTFCGTPNPDAPPKAAARPASEPFAPQPGGYLAAFLPAGARRCGEGHVYAGEHGENCPRCAGRSRGGGSAIPASLAAILRR